MCVCVCVWGFVSRFVPLCVCVCVVLETSLEKRRQGKMPAILVASKMKSELPKPVHSALPIPQHPAKTGTLPVSKLKAVLGSQSPHRTLQRYQSLGSGTPVKRSPASKGSTGDPQVRVRPWSSPDKHFGLPHCLGIIL